MLRDAISTTDIQNPQSTMKGPVSRESVSFFVLKAYKVTACLFTGSRLTAVDREEERLRVRENEKRKERLKKSDGKKRMRERERERERKSER